MLAIRRSEDHTPLTLRSTSGKPLRASIGAKRNPDSTRAILEAAETILKRDGLSGLSMDAIARLAQCGKPTLYRWWPDKCALLAEIHDRALPAFVSIENGSNEDRLDRLAAHWVAAWRTTLAGVALRGMLAEAQLSAAAHATLIEHGLAPYRVAVEGCVASAEVETVLSQTLFPLLGGLMLHSESSEPVVKRDRQPVMRAVSGPMRRGITAKQDRVVAAPGDQQESTLRHRGEWVD